MPSHWSCTCINQGEKEGYQGGNWYTTFLWNEAKCNCFFLVEEKSKCCNVYRVKFPQWIWCIGVWCDSCLVENENNQKIIQLRLVCCVTAFASWLSKYVTAESCISRDWNPLCVSKNTPHMMCNTAGTVNQVLLFHPSLLSPWTKLCYCCFPLCPTVFGASAFKRSLCIVFGMRSLHTLLLCSIKM